MSKNAFFVCFNPHFLKNYTRWTTFEPSFVLSVRKSIKNMSLPFDTTLVYQCNSCFTIFFLIKFRPALVSIITRAQFLRHSVQIIIKTRSSVALYGSIDQTIAHQANMEPQKLYKSCLNTQYEISSITFCSQILTILCENRRCSIKTRFYIWMTY